MISLALLIAGFIPIQTQADALTGCRRILPMSKERVVVIRDSEPTDKEFAIIDSDGRLIQSGKIPISEYVAGTDGDSVIARAYALAFDDVLSGPAYPGTIIPFIYPNIYDGFVEGFLDAAGIYVQPPDMQGFILPGTTGYDAIAVDRSIRKVVMIDETTQRKGDVFYPPTMNLSVYDWSGHRRGLKKLRCSNKFGECFDRSMAFLDNDTVLTLFVVQLKDDEIRRLHRLGDVPIPSPDGNYTCICKISTSTGIISPMLVVPDVILGDMPTPFKDALVVLRGKRKIVYCDSADKLDRYSY